MSLMHLVSNLDRKKYEPHVIVTEEGVLAERLREMGVPVIVQEIPAVFQLHGLNVLRSIYRLIRISKNLNINLMHTDGPRNTFYASVVTAILKIPLIWHIRVSNKDYFDRILFCFCDRLILVADGLRSRFSWVKKTEKLVTIHNGINLDDFTPSHVKGEESVVPLTEKSKIIIGMVGRVEKPKGQKTLIEACGLLGSMAKNVEILIVGKIIEQDYLEECSQKSSELGIEKNVKFLGYREDINRLLNKMDIFAFTSVAFDAFPRTIIEAMGAGKPVITTDVGGCSEAVKEGVTGFVIPKGDPAALADRISQLVSNRKVRLKMGRAARGRARDLFSIESNVRKTEQIYVKVLSAYATD